MSRRIVPFVVLAGALLSACSGWLGHSGEGSAAFATPSITIVGADSGTLVLTPGQSKTIIANEAGYAGTYVFTVADASVATLSVPVGFSARHRDATASNVTVREGAATVTADGVGTTALSVHAGAVSVSVPISVVRAPPTPTSSPMPTSSPTPSPTPTATPVPTATPNPPPTAPLLVNETELDFKSLSPDSVLVTEAGYSGVLSETDDCTGIATISPTSSTSPYTANVRPLAPGLCTVNFTDGTQVVPLIVNVL